MAVLELGGRSQSDAPHVGDRAMAVHAAFALAVVVASRRRWAILGGSAVLLLAAAAEHANIVKLERQPVVVPGGGDRCRRDRDRGVVLGART